MYRGEVMRGNLERRCKSILARLGVTGVVILALVVTGCVTGSATNGQPAATLSGNQPGGAGGAGGSPGTGGGSTGTGNTGTGQRPSRPGSISSFFSSIPQGTGCGINPAAITVPAGTSTTAFSIEELPGSPLPVCITGLAASSPPRVIITAPSGARYTAATGSVGGSEWEWDLYPGPGEGPAAAVGEYTFQVLASAPAPTAPTPTATATSSQPASPTPSLTSASTESSSSTLSEESRILRPDSRTLPRLTARVRAESIAASGRFTVVRSATPRAVVISNQLPAQLEVSLAGFPGNSAIYLSLYGPLQQQTYPLLLDLPVVTANAAGEAIARWEISLGASDGDYAVLINPPPLRCGAQQGCLKFSIRH
jgi:hypothetical protein